MTVYTVGVETFASQKTHKSFAFHEQKLSRMGQKSFFHEHGRSVKWSHLGQLFK